MENASLPTLSAPEIRVLGALMEKSKTTPDYYPMTLNGVIAACNQKTSRSPVVDYDEATVTGALDSLKRRGLVSTATGGGSRVMKYKQNFGIAYPVSDAALAVMCLLFLRGPLTPGEINSNSGRLHEFSSLDSVLEVLAELREHDPPFVAERSRRPGQKEVRYAHLFGEANEEPAQEERIDVDAEGALEQRVTELERQVALLNTIVGRLTGDNA